MADISHILHSFAAADSERNINVGCDEFRLESGDRHHKDQMKRSADNGVKYLVMTEDVVIPDPQLLPEAVIFLCQGTDIFQCQLLNAAVLKQRHLLTGVHGVSRDRVYGSVYIFFHRHPLPFPEF